MRFKIIQPLDRNQTLFLLQLCSEAGVGEFTASFISSTDAGAARMKAFLSVLRPFTREIATSADIQSRPDRRHARPHWALNNETINMILDMSGGSLTSYQIGKYPEDWIFFTQDAVFLDVISHEGSVVLNLDGDWAETKLRLEFVGVKLKRLA